MGCLKNILTLVVLIFAAIGFVQTGAWDFCKKMYDEHQSSKSQSSQSARGIQGALSFYISKDSLIAVSTL